MYIFISVLVAVLVTFLFHLKWSADDINLPMTWIKRAAVFIISIVVLSLQPYTIHRVDAGNVGIEFHMAGNDRGVSKYEYASGYVVYNTWFVKLYEFPTYQRHVTYDEQTVITKGGLTCDVTPSFNYKLKATDVGDMFISLRLELSQVEQQWLKNAVAGTINDVANRWAVDSIFNHRQEFEANVISEINLKVTKWFELSQMRTNIKPPPSLQSSIVAKTNALQNVQVAENEKKVAVARGLARVAEAKADSSVAVTKAAGEARAIREKQLTLTPLYVQYIIAQTWDGKLPTTQAGGGSPILLGVH
jgi:regulator of protease activity HflC (stomatin/prohibitin superfamily)